MLKPLRSHLKRMSKVAAAVHRNGLPKEIVEFPGGIGDDLLCTAVLHELRRRGHSPPWMMSEYAPLFANNPDVRVVVPKVRSVLRLLARLGAPVRCPLYLPRDAGEEPAPMPAQHLITSMCHAAGMTGEVTLRPRLFLTDAERAAGKRVDRQVAIMSSGLGAKHPMRNKDWVPSRFAEVVKRLGDRVSFVQLGSLQDPPLPGALDLRGKTSLRETAAILNQSMCFVGLVGFLMHLARAVDCRSVIVYGGREQPEKSGYQCNINLFSHVPCSPCWFFNRCDFGRRCMDMITVDEVCDAVLVALDRTGEPLVEETETIVVGPTWEMPRIHLPQAVA